MPGPGVLLRSLTPAGSAPQCLRWGLGATGRCRRGGSDEGFSGTVPPAAGGFHGNGTHVNQPSKAGRSGVGAVEAARGITAPQRHADDARGAFVGRLDAGVTVQVGRRPGPTLLNRMSGNTFAYCTVSPARRRSSCTKVRTERGSGLGAVGVQEGVSRTGDGLAVRLLGRDGCPQPGRAERTPMDPGSVPEAGAGYLRSLLAPDSASRRGRQAVGSTPRT